MNYDVYLAAPFFSRAERDHNNMLLNALESNHIRVFSPERDGIIAKDALAAGRSQEEVLSSVWTCDTQAIIESKLVLAVLDGRVIDEGVCVEIGYAAALEKTVIGYFTDDRSCFSWGLNPMVLMAMKAHAADIDSAVSAVAKALGPKI
jgi:nucleoside 2-deoxyribosyltransferase